MFVLLLAAGKSGLMSRLLGSVDTEEVRELKANLLDQRIQDARKSIHSAQEELRYRQF
jgi:sorting nexin-4